MKHHEELISNAMEQLGQIFQGSKQSVYLYLDNTHKSCNSNFAKLLGYSSPEEWSSMDVNFPEVFVSSKSRKTLVTAYQKAMEEQIGSTINVTWKRKDGKDVSSEVILVPYSHGGHLMALHFITKKAAKR